jgi:hypothetical protein
LPYFLLRLLMTNSIRSDYLFNTLINILKLMDALPQYYTNGLNPVCICYWVYEEDKISEEILKIGNI